MPAISNLPPLKGNRCCGNCGCYSELAPAEPGAPSQGFCLKDPPNFGKVRVLVPRMNARTGAPDLDKAGNIVQVPSEQPAYSFRPTLRELYCMDGWRPVGAKPGQSARDVILEQVAVIVARFLGTETDPQAMIAELLSMLTRDPDPLPAAGAVPAPAPPAAGPLN